MKKLLLGSLLSLVTLGAYAVPSIILSNSTNQAYQLVWYISIPKSGEIISYQQVIPANSQNIEANPGINYITFNQKVNPNDPVSISAAAYASNSHSQFADNSLAVKLYQGDQFIDNSHFNLNIALRDTGIAVFIQSSS